MEDEVSKRLEKRRKSAEAGVSPNKRKIFVSPYFEKIGKSIQELESHRFAAAPTTAANRIPTDMQIICKKMAFGWHSQ